MEMTNPLKKIINAASLPITVRHSRWMELNSNTKYNEKALKFAADALAQDVGGNRKRAKRLFRSSAMGQCDRKRVMAYIGAPEQIIENADLANIFHTGNFLHLKWQMAGLTEGWLEEAEVPVESETMLLGGTMDGILYNGHGFEFKTINSNGFRYIMDRGPDKKHILQVHSYMAMTDIEQFSIVYENKDTGVWREFGVKKDAQIISEVISKIDDLTKSIENEELPRMLPLCETREGSEFRYCQFSEICGTSKFADFK